MKKTDLMLKNTSATILLITITVFFGSAYAVDLRIQPRFKTGIQFYEFRLEEHEELEARDPRKTLPTKQSSIEFNDWLPFVSGGGTLFVDRFFVDFDAQYLFGGEASSQFNSQTFSKGGRDLPFDTFFVNNGKVQADFNRFELSISAGFEIFDNLVLFGGYKYAKTNFTSAVIGNITATPAYSEFIIPRLTGSTQGDVEIDFDFKGSFVGLNYSWPIQKSFLDGGLSFNFAVAFLDSHTKLDLTNLKVKSASGEMTTLDVEGNNFFALDGDTQGYSFGVNWQGLTAFNGLTYLMGVTGYRYDFSGSDTNENRVRLDFGLAYAFDF
ncbi:MAG: hypothetical protein KAH20_09440 [Methylococcales bacterium]|nr:hypothetical protein [Methylococcales bacterium]